MTTTADGLPPPPPPRMMPLAVPPSGEGNYPPSGTAGRPRRGGEGGPRGLTRAASILPLAASLVLLLLAGRGTPPKLGGRHPAAEPTLPGDGPHAGLSRRANGTGVAVGADLRRRLGADDDDDDDDGERIAHAGPRQAGAYEPPPGKRGAIAGAWGGGGVGNATPALRPLRRLAIDDYETMSGSGDFSCYRTVDGTYQTMRRIARSYSNLAKVVRIGKSYEGEGLRVLVLTNRAREGEGGRRKRKKGVFFAVFGLHAREYAPPELGARFAEMLVQGYGRSAEITWILDHTDIHLLLHANPDGRRVVEVDRTTKWRKNRNPTNGCKLGTYGVDLNRNFGFMYGRSDGSSVKACRPDYRGPEAFSESESRAIADYAAKIFPSSQAEADPNMPRDADGSKGIFLDVHSFGPYVIWPWTYKDERVPNYDDYRALGHKLCSFNGYGPSASGNKNFLYEASGTTIDYTWGVLGVPSFLYEIGLKWFEPCKYFESNVVPGNLQSLLYAAKVSSVPLLIAKGPDVMEMNVPPGRVPIGQAVKVSAKVSDSARTVLKDEEYVESGRQNIREVRLFVDEHPYDEDSSQGADMPFMRGESGAPTKWATVDVDTSGLTGGRHTACVRGQDTDGYWGPVTCAFFRTCVPERCPANQV